MRKKYYKDKSDEWQFVSISNREEIALLNKFIEEYVEIIRMIEVKLDKKDQKYIELIFDKIASPAHYKFEEVLERKRDEAKHQTTLLTQK